jgi:SAM-dependent methyltransferase
MCPYCGKESAFRFSAKDWNQRTSTEEFAYYFCRSCALTFIGRLPKSLALYYVNEQYDIPADAESFEARSESQRWKIEILRSLARPGTLLEVGPATGEFSYVARKEGFAPMLLEMDENCCRFLRDALRMNVVQTANPAASLDSPAQYSAICIWQAIEHIPEFWKLMQKAADRLAQGGVMILSTPNPRSVQARILGRYWPHLDAPRHLYLIPQIWMRSFAQKHGLTVVLDTTRDVGSIGLNYYGWYLTVRNALRRRGSERWTTRLAMRVTSILRWWEEKEGSGCSYTIAMRRP